jgi:hypothetical protein
MMKNLKNNRGSALVQVLFVVIIIAVTAQHAMQRITLTGETSKNNDRRTAYGNFVKGMRNLLEEPTSCYQLLQGENFVNGAIKINTDFGNAKGPITAGWYDTVENVYIGEPQIRFNPDSAALVDKDYIRDGYYDSADPAYRVWKGTIRFKPMTNHPKTGKRMFDLGFERASDEQYIIDLVFYISIGPNPVIMNCFGAKSPANACTMTGGSYDSRDNAVFNSNVRCQPDVECRDSSQGIVNDFSDCVAPYDQSFLVGRVGGTFKYMCKWCNQNRHGLVVPVLPPPPPVIPGNFAHTFVTDLPAPGDMGNKAGADAHCTARAFAMFGADANLISWKAFIGTNTRHVCTTPGCSGGVAENLDWVMEAGTEYRRMDGITVIGTTNEDAILGEDDFINSFDDGPNGLAWSGIADDGTNHVNNCSDFTDASISLSQIERFKAVADVAGNSNTQGVLLYDDVGSVAFWIDVDNSGSLMPAWAGMANRAIEITTINTGDAIGLVATAFATAINADIKFTAVSVPSLPAGVTSSDVIISHVPPGPRVTVADGDGAPAFFTSFSVDSPGSLVVNQSSVHDLSSTTEDFLDNNNTLVDCGIPQHLLCIEQP